MPDLLGNSTLTWVNDGNYSQQFTLGHRFYCDVASLATAIKWRSQTTNSAEKPSRLYLFREAPSQHITIPLNVNHGGTVGWHASSMAPAIKLEANVVYIVAFLLPAGTPSPSSSSARTAPSAPLNFGNPFGVQSLIGQDTMPTNPSGSGAWAIDIEVTVDPNPPPLSEDIPDPDDSNAAWHSSDPEVNTHETDSLTWLTKAQLTTVEGKVDATKTVADAIQDILEVMNPRLADVWEVAGNLTEIEMALARDLLRFGKGIIDNLLGWNGGVAKPAERRDLPTQLDDIETALPSGADFQALREQLNFSPAATDLARWTKVAELDGSGDATWEEQADRYLLTWSTIPSGQPAHNLDGTYWLPRAGWWAPIRDGYVGPRGFLDFANNDLRWNGQLMHGLVIYSHPGFEYHVEAWVLDR